MNAYLKQEMQLIVVLVLIILVLTLVISLYISLTEPQYVVQEYTVVRGDSLWGLAKQYAKPGDMYVWVVRLHDINSPASLSNLQPGDHINILVQEQIGE